MIVCSKIFHCHSIPLYYQMSKHVQTGVVGLPRTGQKTFDWGLLLLLYSKGQDKEPEFCCLLVNSLINRIKVNLCKLSLYSLESCSYP